MATDTEKYGLGVVLDIGAFGYELAMLKGWGKIRDDVRRMNGSDQVIYDLIFQAGKAFEEARVLERVSWHEEEPNWLIWDDELMGYAEKVLTFLERSRGKAPSKEELLKMAREQLVGEEDIRASWQTQKRYVKWNRWYVICPKCGNRARCNNSIQFDEGGKGYHFDCLPKEVKR